MQELHILQIDPIIRRALEEDWGSGDWTTDLCVPFGTQSKAIIIARGETVVSGIEVAKAVFLCVDPSLQVEILVENGSKTVKNQELLRVSGRARSILKAERVALNFLGHMSGIAWETRKYVEKLKPYRCKLLDTRKTTPGLRILEKAATATGGARNHRLCLTDGVLVKENHIRAAGGIKEAVNRLLEGLPPTIKIEVETTNLSEVNEALEAGADLIMLDNMPHAEMAMAVRTVRGRVLLEASGNVTLDNIASIAETGVDFVSSSAVFHGGKRADLSLLFV